MGKKAHLQVLVWFRIKNFLDRRRIWLTLDGEERNVAQRSLQFVMHESIPGVTIPPREHTRAFDLIGYDSVNARVPGHNLKTNARPLSKLRVENAPPWGRFHETLTTNVPNFVAKFASSLRSSEAHIGIHKPICKQSP